MIHLFWLKKVFKRALLVYSIPPTSKLDSPLKYYMLLAVTVPKITASHHCITSYQWYKKKKKKNQHSVRWGLIRSLQNTTSHFTQTQLLEQNKQSQQVGSLDMKRGLGDVHCLRRCYSIWTRTNTKREWSHNTTRQRSMKLFVWKYFLIKVTRKWVFLSGMWNVLPSASDLVCA